MITRKEVLGLTGEQKSPNDNSDSNSTHSNNLLRRTTCGWLAELISCGWSVQRSGPIPSDKTPVARRGIASLVVNNAILVAADSAAFGVDSAAVCALRAISSVSGEVRTQIAYYSLASEALTTNT